MVARLDGNRWNHLFHDRGTCVLRGEMGSEETFGLLLFVLIFFLIISIISINIRIYIYVTKNIIT